MAFGISISRLSFNKACACFEDGRDRECAWWVQAAAYREELIMLDRAFDTESAGFWGALIEICNRIDDGQRHYEHGGAPQMLCVAGFGGRRQVASDRGQPHPSVNQSDARHCGWAPKDQRLKDKRGLSATEGADAVRREVQQDQ